MNEKIEVKKQNAGSESQCGVRRGRSSSKKEGLTMRNGADYARNVRIECIHRVGRTGSCS